MHEWLDNLKPKRCFLVKYECMGPTPHEYADLIHVYIYGENASTAPIKFNSDNILPEQFQSELNAGVLVMTPLYSDNNLYGYMLIDLTDMKILYTGAAAQSIGNYRYRTR